MPRTLTPERIAAMQEGRRRKAAEDAQQPDPPKDPKLGDKYTKAKALRRMEEHAPGITPGDKIRVVWGRHAGKTFKVEVVNASEAEVFAGHRWWSAYISRPQFERVR